MSFIGKRILLSTALAVAFSVIAGNMISGKAFAATTAYVPPAKISLTFDDGLTSAYTNAAPILAKYGLTGTDYVPTGCIDSKGTCPENTDASYMTWPQVQALQNTYHWEIGSHSVNTPCLASSAQTDPADCPNPKPLTTAQIDAELSNSKTTLQSYGLNVTDFAPPYGDFNNNVIAQIAKYYASMKQFKNAANNPNSWPYSDYYLQDYAGGIQQNVTTVSSVETAINNAITNHQWLVLTFHDILPKPSSNPDDYQYGTAELTQIAAYVQAKQNAGLIQSVHVNQGLVTSKTNLLPNSGFASGIAQGWSTDAPATITANTADNGSFPNPTDSVKLVSTSSTTHLFSPQVPVSYGTTYVLKNFLNVKTITSGLVGFYVDEYNTNGNWISGHWLGQENSSFVEDMNFAYTPSSTSVNRARIQVIVSANPGITAFVDNFQWFPISSTTNPNSANLMPNPNFITGINDGWSTDAPSNITGDSNNNGSPADPTYSAKLTSSTANVHLFSPEVAVSPLKSYMISAYLNLQQIEAGYDVGFYVDEYDTNGNWISGQYELSANTLGSENYSFNYTLSSSNVAYASVQVIVMGNSNTLAYISNVQMFQD